jgi:hypothetical protein
VCGVCEENVSEKVATQERLPGRRWLSASVLNGGRQVWQPALWWELAVPPLAMKAWTELNRWSRVRAARTARQHRTDQQDCGRQLDAAIRMFFAREDELAIHTLACGAFRILRDVTKKRGKELHGRGAPARHLRHGAAARLLLYSGGSTREISLPWY